MAYKSLVVLTLLFPALAISYYFAVSLPAHNQAVLDFERQKYNDQKQKDEQDGLLARQVKWTRLSRPIFVGDKLEICGSDL